MKKLLFAILTILVTTACYGQQFNVITYNIRLNTSSDGINAWPNRKEMVTALLKFHDAAIFGLQEAKHDQILDLEERLPGWAAGVMTGKQAESILPFSTT